MYPALKIAPKAVTNIRGVKSFLPISGRLEARSKEVFLPLNCNFWPLEVAIRRTLKQEDKMVVFQRIAIHLIFCGLVTPSMASQLPIENDDKEVEHRQITFRNWGGTIENDPSYTFFPKTKTGVCNIVKWAKSQNKNVRASGYRHTWSDLYSDDNQVLVSLRSQREVEPPAIPPPPLDGELQSIELVGVYEEEGHPNKHLCKIGAATTNEQFRQWCMERFKHDPANSWTLPLNVIMVEITFGGSNAPICHGAGWKNKTLSDLVTEIEFVNPLGELQTVKDTELIKTASGCFGMLGIVTSLTLKLDPITHARMSPSKPRLALAVPPPENFQWPDQAMKDKFMKGVSDPERIKSQQDFISRCAEHYYSEWFWFSLHDKCWVNTWQNDGRAENSREVSQ
jgi:hypothetical protein